MGGLDAEIASPSGERITAFALDGCAFLLVSYGKFGIRGGEMKWQDSDVGVFFFGRQTSERAFTLASPASDLLAGIGLLVADLSFLREIFIDLAVAIVILLITTFFLWQDLAFAGAPLPIDAALYAAFASAFVTHFGRTAVTRLCIVVLAEGVFFGCNLFFLFFALGLEGQAAKKRARGKKNQSEEKEQRKACADPQGGRGTGGRRGFFGVRSRRIHRRVGEKSIWLRRGRDLFREEGRKHRRLGKSRGGKHWRRRGDQGGFRRDRIRWLQRGEEKI